MVWKAIVKSMKPAVEKRCRVREPEVRLFITTSLIVRRGRDPMKRLSRRALSVVLATAVIASASVDISVQREDWTEPATREWPLAGGDWRGTRYSALTQVDATTVTQLRGAWVTELPGRESQNKVTPIVRDGLMYVVTGTSVHALDARTGARVWSQPTNTQMNRGIAVGDGLVFVGQFDASVVALDWRTGQRVWTYAEKMDAGQRITGPPVTRTVSSSSASLAGTGSSAAVSWRSTRRPVGSSGASTRCPRRASRDQRRGPPTTTCGSTAVELCGRSRWWIVTWASSTCRRATPCRPGAVSSAPATISTPAPCWRST
ncbi:MAG: hypothetical protein FJW27_00880 [Acidimicrobiia bacterium]|nr:hypothetical protein [Acidimicrobiia bacterium]